MSTKHSQLPWRLSFGTLQVSIYSADTGVVAYMPRVEYERPKPIINEEEKANADLILAAVNACGKVNPNNPIAAAEALPELLDFAIQYLYSKHYECSPGHLACPYSREQLGSMARAAITNAKRGA